jgi:hypothetical protein
LGFVTSNSWLDVRYGAGLQKFFLDNFKIISIIESKVERSFAKADINTAITIVERCSDKKKRDNHVVKFVVLKEKMDVLIPKDGDRSRFEACDKLIYRIAKAKSIYEDSEIRVLPKKQKELYEEGIEDHTYVGSKWGGKYLRAPDIFFKILEKGKDLFVPLKDIAEVKRGFTTGANEFFYLTEEQIRAHMIEKEFLKLLIKSPQECSYLQVAKVNIMNKVVLIRKKRRELRGTNVSKYILWGEEKGYQDNPTCKQREKNKQSYFGWYDLGEWKIADLLWPDAYDKTFGCFVNQKNVYADKRFFLIYYTQDAPGKKILTAFLNSTIVPLFIELFGIVNLGQGVVYTNVYQLKELPILKPSILNKTQIKRINTTLSKIQDRELMPIFEEVKQKDRQELDNVFFDILGLTKDERQQVYDAVCELVRNRLEKAKTFGKNNKNQKEEFNPTSYADHILSEVFLSQQKKEFPNDFVNPSWETVTIALPKVEPKGKLTIEEFFGKASLRIDGETVDCGTTPKANFVELAIEKGIRDKVIVPADDKNCIKAVRDYLNYRKIIETQIEETMKMFNLTKKQTKAVLSEIEDRY